MKKTKCVSCKHYIEQSKLANEIFAKSSQFCSYCGSKMIEKIEGNEFCGTCGKEWKKKYLYCPKYGGIRSFFYEHHDRFFIGYINENNK